MSVGTAIEEPRTTAMRLVTASASQATVAFEPIEHAGELTGVLRGPFCARAKTLPTDFTVANGRSTVFEPCYWTPQLPFLYEVQLRGSSTAGNVPSSKLTFGLRGLYARRHDFMVDGKRVVLRGGGLAIKDSRQLDEAYEVEAAIIVEAPSTELCVEASCTGVAILADLRSLGDAWRLRALQLSWSPAVALVLVSGDQLREAAAHFASQVFDMPVAQVIDAASTPESIQPGAQAAVVELRGLERPAEWLAQTVKPVIGWRRLELPQSLSEKRAACDRLQAELAPEFDLAGYFT